MSSTTSRHRKPPRSPRTGPDAASQPRKRPSIRSALKDKPALIVGGIIAALLALVSAWPAAAHWMAGAANTAWSSEADALGLQIAARLGAQARQQPVIVSQGVAVSPNYLNPFRNLAYMIPERIDQGVDFSGSGPIYALGDGIVTQETAYQPGWPGGWVSYQLTDGPAQGLVVYVAEDVTPTVQVGQEVTPYTVIADMYDGAAGIETGWAQPTGPTPESQLAAAGGIGGLGPFPTKIGLNFDELLQSLGVPASPDANQTAWGLLPANYPSAWS